MNVTGDATVAIYVSLAVALAVWIGIFAYLWIVERKVHEVQRKLEKLQHHGPSNSQPKQQPAPEPVAILERRTQQE